LEKKKFRKKVFFLEAPGFFDPADFFPKLLKFSFCGASQTFSGIASSPQPKAGTPAAPGR